MDFLDLLDELSPTNPETDQKAREYPYVDRKEIRFSQVATRKEIDYLREDARFLRKLAFKFLECGEIGEDEYINLMHEIGRDDVPRYRLKDLTVSHLPLSLQILNSKYINLSKRAN